MGNTIIDNIVLENSPRLGITGGPNFSTTIVRSSGGWRQAQSNWDAPLWSYKLKYIERKEDFHEIISFWIGRKGPAYGFLVKDVADCTDGGKGKVLLVDGKYRLAKTYDDPIRPFDRIITRPISGTITLSGVTGATEADIDFSTGIVANATSTGTWTGEFYCPVAFKKDAMDYDFKPSSLEGYMEWDCEVEEVRV